MNFKERFDKPMSKLVAIAVGTAFRLEDRNQNVGLGFLKIPDIYQ